MEKIEGEGPYPARDYLRARLKILLCLRALKVMQSFGAPQEWPRARLLRWSGASKGIGSHRIGYEKAKVS